MPTLQGLFVTGTDTGVGKTLVAAGLVRGLVSLNQRVAVMKPVASGAVRADSGKLHNEDALELQSASNIASPLSQINPYCFEPAIAPHIAAREAGVRIDIEQIVQSFRELGASADWVVVEGAGGWLAPLNVLENDQQTFADIALALQLPVMLVVGLRLGCLNHALLTRQAIAAKGARFAGWVGNTLEPDMPRLAENLAALTAFLERPPLAVVPYRPSKQLHEPLLMREAARQLLVE